MPSKAVLPSGWRWATVEEVALDRKGAIKIGPFGSQLKKEDLAQAGYKVYGQENIIANDFAIGDRYVDEAKFQALQSCQLEPGDFVVTMMGTIGNCAVFPEQAETGIMDSHLLRIQPDPSVVDTKYLAAAMSSDDLAGHQVTRLSHGSIMSGLSSKIVRSLALPIPPLPEQRRIAEILDTVDEAIACTEQVIAKLCQVKTGLLHDLLSCGLDEHGQLRDPVAHPEQFRDSPLGRIPREWEVERVGNLSESITSGSRGWAAYYAEEGPIFLRIGNLTREHINLRLDNVIHVQPPANSEGKRTAVQDGDILISITADLGIIAVIPPDFGEAYVNQHIALIRLERTKARSRWVGHYLTGQSGQTQFYKLNDAGAKAGLNLPTVGSLLVALPPGQEQENIVSILDAHDARIRTEEAYREKLRLLKAGLMDDLLTGRVRVDREEG